MKSRDVRMARTHIALTLFVTGNKQVGKTQWVAVPTGHVQILRHFPVIELRKEAHVVMRQQSTRAVLL